MWRIVAKWRFDVAQSATFSPFMPQNMCHQLLPRGTNCRKVALHSATYRDVAQKKLFHSKTSKFKINIFLWIFLTESLILVFWIKIFYFSLITFNHTFSLCASGYSCLCRLRDSTNSNKIKKQMNFSPFKYILSQSKKAYENNQNFMQKEINFSF